MSGALAPLAIKMVSGAVVSKLVGKVTGNEKLGMIAGLATGFANPLGAGAGVGATTATATGANIAPAAATSAAIPASTIGNGMISAVGMEPMVSAASGGGMLSGAANFIQENPAMSMIGAQTVMGGVAGYEGRKEASRERDFLKSQNALTREHDATMAQDAYDRTHQPLPAGYSIGGGSSSSPAPTPQRPMTAPEQYFKRYSEMYGRVR